MSERPLAAIPTTYKGIEFKSRMEAQCAVLFDKLGWEWEYEKYSLMLEGGTTFIPDFWLRSNWAIAECRGYENKRGVRQIDAFAELVESKGFSLPEEPRCKVFDFLVIGPYHAAVYGKHKTRIDYTEEPPSLREDFMRCPAIFSKCACGWKLANRACWCPNCDKFDFRVAILTVESGRLYLNGATVEDFVA